MGFWQHGYWESEFTDHANALQQALEGESNFATHTTRFPQSQLSLPHVECALAGIVLSVRGRAPLDYSNTVFDFCVVASEQLETTIRINASSLKINYVDWTTG